jgi:acyl-CoA hydrolase
VVTYCGIGALKERIIKERIEWLTAIAHPDFRQELRREARRLPCSDCKDVSYIGRGYQESET